MGNKRKTPSDHPKGVERLLALVLALTMVVSSVVNGQIVGVVYMSKNYVSASGETYRVSLRYEEGVLPSGCELEVQEIDSDSDEYASYLEAAKETVDGRVVDAGFLDIRIVKDGVEIEPEGEVRVEITRIDGEKPGETVNVVHFGGQEAEEEALVGDNLSLQTMGYLTEDEEITTERGFVDVPQLVDSVSVIGNKVSFKTNSFSVYGVIYTVDFHWDVDGKEYSFSIPGGGYIKLSTLLEILKIADGEVTTDEVPEESRSEEGITDEVTEDNQNTDYDLNSVVISEATKNLLADIESVTFSDPSLVWIGKVEEESTIGEIKEANGLECEYSAELSQEEIVGINEFVIEAGEWVIISLVPFDSEEELTVHLYNGDEFSIKVTDAQPKVSAEEGQLDPNKSYIIFYHDENTNIYYLLKNNGDVDDEKTPSNTNQFENLNSDYCWRFNYVFTEKDREPSLDYNYYLIRPIDNNSKTIALNEEGKPLVQASNNNVAVVPIDGGFHLIGYNNVKLNFENGQFSAKQSTEQNPFDGVKVYIWEMNSLPTYNYKVRSSDTSRGTVSVSDGTPKSEIEDGDTVNYVEAKSTSAVEKKNAGTITATPVSKLDGSGHNKWIFDHWEQDDARLDNVDYPATIPAESLPIPFNGSKLIAYFIQNPDYIVPDTEKQSSSFEDLSNWLSEVKDSSEIPLDETNCKKTAEVYDYENRIYQVDLTAKSNLELFEGRVDLGFMIDVSGSMKFPSKIVKYDNLSQVKLYKLNDSNYNSGLDTSKTYYFIADEKATATVYRLWYASSIRLLNSSSSVKGKNGYSNSTISVGGTNFYYKDIQNQWVAVDASHVDSETQFGKYVREIGYSGNTLTYPFTTEKSDYAQSADTKESTYQIYYDAQTQYQRKDHLESSINNSTTELKNILDALKIAATNTDNQDVRIAYNTFCATVTKSVDFQSVSSGDVSFEYAYAGGTRTDSAFEDATNNFTWTRGDYNTTGFHYGNYAILITDGAPQYSNNQVQGKVAGDPVPYTIVKEQADALKKGPDGIEGTEDDVTLITVGLSMQNVDVGRIMLYNLADTIDGEKMFFNAESGDELEDIIYSIIKMLMKHSNIKGTIVDTVGPAFCPVDKRTGLPLDSGSYIDIDGNKIDGEPSGQYGQIVKTGDEYKIIWTGQDISWDGWHGTAYVKAKEDLIGGNAVNTNISATIQATDFMFYGSDIAIPLKDDFKKNVRPPSPKVNVNELTIHDVGTEWTVYLGESVDPASQIEGLFERTYVEEVVNTTNGLLYLLSPKSITDDREKDAEGNSLLIGTPQTFDLAPVILDRIINEGVVETIGGTKQIVSGNKYLKEENGKQVIDWSKFLPAILTTDGVAVAYHPYGIEGIDSRIEIKLEKQVVEDEEDDLINESPHNTTVLSEKNNDGTLKPVEKYVLSVKYYPDYDHVLPPGQGGKVGEIDFHTGTYGTMYQGHSAGNETGLNTHEIKTYVAPINVLKTDESNEPLRGATFSLYKKDNNGSSVDGLSGNYIEVASGTSGTDGIAYLVFQENMEEGLLLNTTYYLLETSAPENYVKSNTVWTVEVQKENGKFTNLDGSSIDSTVVTETMYPFNWDEGSRLILDGKDYGSTISKTEIAGQTTTLTGGTYVSYTKLISLQHDVENKGGNIEITVNKSWDDDNDPDRPTSITVKLYRISKKGHQYGNATITPCTCTDDGVKVYTCSVCGNEERQAISAKGHTRGTPRIENEMAATCSSEGGYDTVTRCTECNAIIESVHTTIPRTQHVWGDEQEEATTQNGYCYDTVIRCTLCNTEKEHSRVHHAHEWGEWQVTTPAQIGVAGEETRVCNHNSAHKETRATNPLPNETVITARTYRAWYGLGWLEGNSTTTAKYPVGSSITLSWSSNNAYDSEVYINSTPTLTDRSQYNYWDGNLVYANGYEFNGGTKKSVARSYSNGRYNYSVTVQVTEGMTLDFTSSIWNDYPSLIKITQNRNGISASTKDTTVIKTNPTIRMDRGNFTTKTINKLLLSNNRLADIPPFLEGIKTKASAACEELYWEEVEGNYTIEGNEWSIDIEDIPKYNEYGNEYSYYVVETEPSSGYEVTYSIPDSGLHDADTADINNKLSITLKILKYRKGSEIPLSSATFTLAMVDNDGKTVQGTTISTSSTNTSGEIKFGGLKAGRYKLEEVGAPAGYVKAEGAYYINITKNDNDTIEGTPNLITVSSNHLYIVENEPGAELPATGGSGTVIFYTVGLLLITMAGFILMMKRKAY